LQVNVLLILGQRLMAKLLAHVYKILAHINVAITDI